MSMPVISSSGISSSQAMIDIVQSVALEKTALAHILNTEAEKINAIVNMVSESGCSSYLLDVNASVNDMVMAIADLEKILKSELELFSNCYGNISCYE